MTKNIDFRQIHNKLLLMTTQILSKMKILKLLFSFSAFLLLFSTLSAQKTIPNVSAYTLEGEEVNLLETYGTEPGKVVIISFWATWCSPCKKELDAIAEIYEEWLDKYDVELVAISIDDQRSLTKVPGIVETKGWEFTVLHADPQTMQNAFNFSTIPQTYVLNKQGHLSWVHNGYTPGDEYELEEVIEKYNAQ